MIDEQKRSDGVHETSGGPHTDVSFHPGRNNGGGHRAHGTGAGASTAHTLLIGESTKAHFTLVYNDDSDTYTFSTGNAIGVLAETIVFKSDVQIQVTSTDKALRIETQDPPAVALRSDGNSYKWFALESFYMTQSLEKSYNTLVPRPDQDGRGLVILLTPYPIELTDAIPAREK